MVLASDEAFDNAALLDRRIDVVPFRLLERVRRGPIVFDESLNGSGRPRIFGVLFARALRPLTLQLLALAVIFAWMGSRRFGPQVGAEAPPRRRMTEHAIALGDLCYKSEAGTPLVAAYVEYFRRELGLAHGARRGIRAVAEAVARRAGTEAPAVAGILARAAESSGGTDRIPNGQAAASVAELAGLKQKIAHAEGRAT